QGVIVGEGITEQEILLAAAKKLEENDGTLFPLDVAGVCVVNADGDGNLEKLGTFFKAIGVFALAFFDRKKRTEEQIAELNASYKLTFEIPYKGAEAMMAAEVPIDRQWQYLESLRDSDSESKFG